jgi:hypothetical protein
MMTSDVAWPVERGLSIKSAVKILQRVMLITINIVRCCIAFLLYLLYLYKSRIIMSSPEPENVTPDLVIELPPDDGSATGGVSLRL